MEPGPSPFASPDVAHLPDLLHEQPVLRIDPEATTLSFVFAFAGATSGGLFHDALNRAQVAPSSFEPKAFAADLFLKSFVNDCLRPNLRGEQPVLATEHLLRLFCRPPSDVGVLSFRREIIWELMESQALRARLEELYVRLQRFRATVEGTSGHDKLDANRRQLSSST
jgi:DNA mismatch repair protein MutS2